VNQSLVRNSSARRSRDSEVPLLPPHKEGGDATPPLLVPFPPAHRVSLKRSSQRELLQRGIDNLVMADNGERPLNPPPYPLPAEFAPVFTSVTANSSSTPSARTLTNSPKHGTPPIFLLPPVLLVHAQEHNAPFSLFGTYASCHLTLPVF